MTDDTRPASKELHISDHATFSIKRLVAGIDPFVIYNTILWETLPQLETPLGLIYRQNISLKEIIDSEMWECTIEYGPYEMPTTPEQGSYTFDTTGEESLRTQSRSTVMAFKNQDYLTATDYVQNGGKSYRCILPHNSEAVFSEPGAGTVWFIYWTEEKNFDAAHPAWVTLTTYDPGGYFVDLNIAAIPTNTHQGMINVDENGVNGVSVITPVFNFSITKPVYGITVDYQRDLFWLTGKVNETPFMFFQRGEVLFNGVSGTFRGDGGELTFKFSAIPNVAHMQIAGFNEGEYLPRIPKEGWQYLWIYYEEEPMANGGNRKVPKEVMIEQVYEYGDFALLQI